MLFCLRYLSCRLWSLALVIAAGGAFAPSVHAADLVTPTSPTVVEKQAGDWTFAFSPYFWGAGLSGDVAQFGLPTTVHISPDFGDILDNLDFAAMATGEARYGRYSVFSDVIYTKLSVGSGTPRGVIADSVDVTSETFAGLVGAGYCVLQDANSNLDIVAAARIWSVSTEISLQGGILGGRSVSDSATWVDAMTGIRGRYFFNDNLYLTGWGLIGAGGATLDWDVAAAIGYQFSGKFSALAGYRALGVNYDNNDFVFDAVQQGPIVGLVLHF
ncbi:hypothetical protein GR212_26705 [Rhizobium lusitanum]|uniref:Outer membrane protein beta-barrel domain-containing protein n=2 Tax=Rhizobium lusitanum TaxID=293958 RepID=A0A6L9UG77_9HYPH|nr:hypothetical protein [Rhizobium lusitanum]